MKLSNLTAKLTCIKRNAIRILTVAALAGATLAAAAPAAQAQQVGFGVHIGGPYRTGPVFYGGYHDRFFAEGRYWADREAYIDFCRHRDWERFHHDRFEHRGWR